MGAFGILRRRSTLEFTSRSFRPLRKMLPAQITFFTHSINNERLQDSFTLTNHTHTASVTKWNQPHLFITHPRTLSTAITTPTQPTSPSDYKPPTTGILSYLPQPWIPYAELIRLDKPTGTYYLFFPCLFSTLLAAPLAAPITPPHIVGAYTSLFGIGALIMRGAGCTINDLWDRNLDPQVERTRLRPIARRAITPMKAMVFTAGQLCVGLAVLLSFPSQCFFYGAPSLILVSIYPLMKRITYYPQFVLGLTFSWGAWIGFPALGIDLLASENSHALVAAGCLYTSCVVWTMIYDLIYACMDIRDDVKAGIKSIALAHQNNTKLFLSALATVQVGLLATAGAAAGAGPVFYLGGVGGAVVSLATMIWRVNLKNVKDCWWWFRYGCWFTGGGISLGLLGDYLSQYFGWYEHEKYGMSKDIGN